jgi:hypothetical protein
MLIANPIYDIVFKFLMEDIEIARDLLSVILKEDITSIELKPQETVTETVMGLKVFRFDFKAHIRNEDGSIKKILIELQKAKNLLDLPRFRQYLGDNYRKEDDVTIISGDVVKQSLPIVTVYFLGFNLSAKKVPVIHINRTYIDVLNNELLDIKVDFVEKLTHDSYLIQIKYLTKDMQTRLGNVLQVFRQTYYQDDKHRLAFENSSNDPLAKRMADRLARAFASEEMQQQMDAEDQIDRLFAKQQKEIQESEQKLQEQEVEIKKKNQEIQEKDTALQEKDTALQEKDTALQEKDTEIAELLKRLKDLENK